MALRFGPITIENGIENTHGGVIIAIRDLPQLQNIPRQDKASHKCLKLTERNLEKENWQMKKKEWTRTVYSEIRHHGPRRYKAVMKQVVGGAFCGFINRDAEREISDCLVKESRQLAIDGLRSSQKTRMIEQATDRIMEKLRPYLSSRVEEYLGSLAGRLLDHNVALRWAYDGNTCQAFCDNLIDFGKFGSLFAPVGDGIPLAPLYLMSFVCRPDAYLSEPGETLYNVPHGLVEEYLLKFRYGRHDESDVIDTLQEYWYDWGNFEGPLYHYQDVFPWDCTEAFCGHPGNCATCSVSKHVWAFPFDSWSIITLHLTRARQFYPKIKPPQKPSNSESSSNTEDTQPLAARKSKGPGTGFMPDLDWFQNRLKILLGQQALLKGATAMAICQTVREAADWIHQAPDGYHDRIKLGGILRAQPFSHHFEKGTYHHYYVAGWSSFSLDDRKKTYEDLRDLRAQLPRAPNGRSGGSSFGTKGDTDVSGGVMVDMSIDSYHLSSSIDGNFMLPIDMLSQLAGPSCAGGAAGAGSSGCAGGGGGGGGGS